MNKIAPNIWTVDGPQVRFAGAPMDTRMTLVLLNDGTFWVHSPIPIDATLRGWLDERGGDVAAIVAPNRYHHLFVQEWRDAFPEAEVYAEARLVGRNLTALQGARTLDDEPPELFRDDLDQVVFAGNPLVSEAVFFHRASRTLIMTDLMINVRTEHMPFFARAFMAFEGVRWPAGGIPRLVRLLTTDRAAARRAAEKMLAWQPERVLLCHGEMFDEPPSAVLEREFAWLF